MRTGPEVSILMPSYNDSKYLPAAINSVLSQTYENWKLIIVDDGSTDNTKGIAKQFDDGRVVYLRQENRGQLNALLKGVQHAKGEYITLLHSDDEFSDSEAVKRSVSTLDGSSFDGLFSDLWTMNVNGEHSGLTKTANRVGPSSPATLFLRGGSNIISDVFFIRWSILNNVISTYLLWNMPYWLRFEDNRIGTMRLAKTVPWYRYRLYPENYVRSEIGRFETLNGCLRTVTEIGKRIHFPFLAAQRLLARTFKTRTRPLYALEACSPKQLRDMAVFTIGRYYEKMPDSAYFNGLRGFYANYPSDRVIGAHLEGDEPVFIGKDSRAFYSAMERGDLPRVYVEILEEATKGFGTVTVRTEEERRKAQDLMRFLNFPVKITKSGS